MSVCSYTGQDTREHLMQVSAEDRWRHGACDCRNMQTAEGGSGPVSVGSTRVQGVHVCSGVFKRPSVHC